MREPTIFCWPGKIQPGVVRGMGSTLDLLPTLAALAGSDLPNDRQLDGYDLGPTLFDNLPSPRQSMFYYHGQEVFAVRQGMYKAHFKTKTSYTSQREAVSHNPPLLFQLGHDPSEKYDVGLQHLDIIDGIRRLKAEHEASLVPVENQLEKS